MEADITRDNKQTKSRPAVTAIVGMLLLLIHMGWAPVPAVSAQESALELAGPGTGTVQAPPTEDATETALKKKKLEQEIEQLKKKNAVPSWIDYVTPFSTSFSILATLAVAYWSYWRWREEQRSDREKRDEDRRSDREKRDEDRFQAAVTGLGSNDIGAKIGAAIMLRTFLEPGRGYEHFYLKAFDLAVAHLRLQGPKPPEALNQALIATFKEAFPRARDELKKQCARSGKLFDHRRLDASYIRLDKAFLWEADLEMIFMPWASLQEADLSDANLRGAKLWNCDLRKVKLGKAKLRGADLGIADLWEADLWEADLRETKLWANLGKAKLCGADLRKAELRGNTGFAADVAGADLRGAKLAEADLGGVKYNTVEVQKVDEQGQPVLDKGKPVTIGLTQWSQDQDRPSGIVEDNSSREPWKL